VIGGAGVLKNTGYYGDFMKPKLGYSAGVGIVHTFSRSFNLRLSTLWETKGSKYSVHGQGTSAVGPIDQTMDDKHRPVLYLVTTGT
jgi:hypothetical protein